MAIFTDPEECDINWCGLQFSANSANDCRHISIALQKVVFLDSRLVDQTLQKVFAKAGRMGNRQPDIFIQVKHLDPGPVYARRTGQGVQKLKLRDACRGNDSRVAVVFYRVAERSCS